MNLTEFNCFYSSFGKETAYSEKSTFQMSPTKLKYVFCMPFYLFCLKGLKLKYIIKLFTALVEVKTLTIKVNR